MITEQTIREAYIHLRTTNTSIPDETLDFMLQAALDKLKIIKDGEIKFNESMETAKNVLKTGL